MDSAQKTLIEIASVSQRVVHTLIGCAGRKTVESFRLDKLVIGSGAVLETFNMTLLLKRGHVDDRLVGWLESDEPQVCLRTLNQMEGILNSKLEYGVMNFFKTSHSTHTRDKSNEAIRLFQMRQGYFHFLLTTDIWNREPERDAHRRPQTLTQHNSSRMEETIDRRDLAPITRRIPVGSVRNQGVDVEKLEIILGWLDAWNCKQTHRRTFRLHQPGTCTWLPGTNAFKTWRRTKDSFLWLHGKAGAGKSVLAAYVIEGLKNTLKDGEVLVFFYCDFRDERSTNAAEVMRSLLSQLLQHLRQHTVGPADLIDNLVGEAQEGALVISDVMLLARYISCVAYQFDQQPLLVVDALDECEDVEEVLDAFVELANGGIRLFVTSRPLQVIKDSLSCFPSISMDAMKYEVQADITLHVMRELDSHRRLRIMDTSLKDEIYSVLCDKADGMFRWVHCQLNTLKRCMTALQIRRALDDLPSDLDATYARILLRINENEREVVRRALCWLVSALKPMKLCQIIEGLSIDLAQRVMDRDSGPVHGPALLDALGSLVTHDEMTDVIVLSHASVKEYLTAKSTSTKYHMYQIDEQHAHTQLALLSMCYITLYLKQSQLSRGYEVSRTTQIDGSDIPSHPIRRRGPPLSSTDSHPLLAYVRSCGFQHLSHVGPKNREVLRGIGDFDSVARLHPSEWERLCRSSSESSLDTQWPALKHDLVLYFLIAFAPAPLLCSYIGRARVRPKDGTNPLTYAAAFRKIEHARILLSRGVSLDHRGWDIGLSHHQVLPLEVAVSRGNHCMVDLFLTEGSPVPHELFEGALRENFRLFPRVVSKLLQTDEFVEWATIGWNERRFIRTLDPTQYVGGYASEEDVETIERRLIQIGCNPSARFDETSLRHAVIAGHISTVKSMQSLNIPLPPDIILNASSSEMISFLLSLGGDADVISPSGKTPLHLAMNAYLPDDECLEKVRILIDAGCDPCASNLAGETPLHVAARIGSVVIVEYLLSLHVPLPPDVLLVASGPSMIHFLLDEGADVSAISADGDTVLHVALSGVCYDSGWDQCLELASTLIDVGCNPCSPNVFGETPFHIAAKKGHLPVVQYLLSLNIPLPSSILLSVVGSFSPDAAPMIKFLIDKGADIHVTSPTGDNLLCVSVTNLMAVDGLSRVKILIDAGCDAHVCNSAGESLLHVAARQRHIPVLEYLFSLDMPAPSDLILTQFDTAGGSSQGCYRTIRLLLDKLGVDIHAVAENGDTLLHLAAGVGTEEQALDLVKLLIHSGCSHCVSNAAQKTPLHIASRVGYISVIDYLLSLGSSLPPDILLAASTGFSERAKLIRYLVQKGADVSVIGMDGATPLHLLFAFGYENDRLECAKLLIDAGCDPQSENLWGETPMHLAARWEFISILEYLLSQGIPLPHDILLASTARTIRFLLDNGVDVQSIAANDDGRLLHCALNSIDSEEDCLERARILVGAAGWNPSSKNFFGETPMHVAVTNVHISIVKYFLSQNATLPDDIILAAVPTDELRLFDEIVPLLHLLISEGANTNATTSNGNNPLHLAMQCNITDSTARSAQLYQSRLCELVEVLLNGGSDPYARNADGKTAIDLAEEKGQCFKENFERLVQNSRVRRTY
ncbi:ankyrin [Imleria badia]|nr:ankyrin [Imleria badia]